MSEFKDLSDRYRQQMLELYKKHPQMSPPEPPPTLDLPEELPLDERFPPPEDLPFLHPQEPPLDIEPDPIPTQPTTNLDSVGYLKVVATSADRTVPVPQASVIISRVVGGGEEILYSLITDDNGETPTVALPTVSAKMSQTPNYSKDGYTLFAIYNVSTYLNGYFEVKNVGVPIFSGVTSIQRVNLIPLPIHTQGRKTITFDEHEPYL